ncbi:MAG TPA: acyl-CoA dehydrogenase [Deltaproteobacteria bacterium]|nr:acyl-CoA dehydrogenase [Deltaproteobacteria bacterium]
MGNGLVNTRDQRFVLYEQIGIERLFGFDKFRDFSRDLIDMMLTEAEKFAVEEILPTYEISDKEDTAVFKDGKAYAPKCFHGPYKKFVEGGWLCPMAPPEVGGQGIPMTVYTACSELFGSANYAFCMYPGLTLGAAAMIATYGTPEQLRKYAMKMFAGEWAGTMCLTEPGAGTDVGALRTTAKRLPDGKFSITGTKCFISAGDHDLTEQIVHPVLARIEGDPPGTPGISIFIVPKYRVNDDGSLGEFNDVATGNIEHKMGIKGSATATLNFGENGNCIGELLGNEREGIKIMFMMMNEARLGTGMQGLDLASVSFEHAVQYAKERIQFRRIESIADNSAPGVAIINHPDIRRSLLWMKSHVEGMRAMNYYIAYCIDMEHIATDEEEKAKMKGIVELLTPISKAYCSDKAVEICSLGIDVFGGYGYCCEYPMEQYLRDVKIATIYEGTNYIQSLDLVGRKLGQRKGQNLMNLFGEIAATIGKAKGREALKPYAELLEGAMGMIGDLTMNFAKWGKSMDYVIPVMNARPFLMMMGDLVIGWKLLDAAGIASDKLDAIYKNAGIDPSQAGAFARDNAEAAFYQGKVASCKYFASNVLPTIEGRCKAIKQADKTPLEIADESFAV